MEHSNAATESASVLAVESGALTGRSCPGPDRTVTFFRPDGTELTAPYSSPPHTRAPFAVHQATTARPPTNPLPHPATQRGRRPCMSRP